MTRFARWRPPVALQSQSQYVSGSGRNQLPNRVIDVRLAEIIRTHTIWLVGQGRSGWEYILLNHQSEPKNGGGVD